MLVLLIAFSAVSAVLADAPTFDAIGDQTVIAEEELAIYLTVTDSDGDEVSSITLTEDSYTSDSSSYDESTDFTATEDAGTYIVDLAWTTSMSDLGEHTFTFSAIDSNGDETSETFTVTVMHEVEEDVEGLELDLANLEEIYDALVINYEDAVAEEDEADLADIALELDVLEFLIEVMQSSLTTTIDAIDDADDDSEIDSDLTAELESRAAAVESGLDAMLEGIEEMLRFIENDEPEFVEIPESDIEINEGQEWFLGFIASDADADETFTFTAEETYTSESSTLDFTDSNIFYEGDLDGEVVLDWTPTSEDIGEHYITITATDSMGAEDSISITLTVLNVNDEPTIESIADQSVSVNTETEEVETFTYQLVVEDLDGDALTYTIQMDGAPSSESSLPTPINTPEISEDAVLTWTPDISEAERTFDVRIVAEDGQGGVSDEVSFDIYVSTESAPSIETIDDVTVTAGDSVDISITSTDPEGDTITLTESGLPSGATLTDNSDGTGSITWDTTDSDVESYDITIAATDSTGEYTTETFTITVEAEVGAPIFGTVSDQSVVAGEELEFTIDVTDNEGDEVTFSTSGLDSDATTSETSGDSGSDTLTITWTPSDSDVGDHSITITATDSNGQSTDASLTITVSDEAVSEWEQDVIDLEDRYDDIEYEYEDDDLEDEYEDAVDDDDESDIEDATEDLEDVLDDLEELMDDIDDLRDDINDAEDDDDISKDEEEDLEDSLDDLEDDVQDLIDEIEDILGIEGSTDGESATEYEGSSSSDSTDESSDDDDSNDVDVETTYLEGEDSGSDEETVTYESSTSFDELRPLLWLCAGIFIAFALLIFALGLLMTRK